MITSEQWDRVVQLCQGSPSEAKKWTTRQGFFEGMKDANVLPIHEALVAGAPYHIIEALLNAYPDSVFCKESSYQRLPLHCACRKNAVPEVVDLLLRKYADASLTPDSLGRLPCKFLLCYSHYAVNVCAVTLRDMIAEYLCNHEEPQWLEMK